MKIITSLSRIKAIVSKELLQLRRDRMTFAMVVMIPLIQLILFGYAINTNVKDIPVAVVDHSKTALSRILVQTVSATNVVKVTDYYDSIEQAQTAIASAKVRAVLFIPHDVANRLAQHPTVGFGLPDEKVSEKAVKFYKSKKIELPWSLRKNQFNFKSSLEDTKMIFEDYDEFIDAARETFKDEIERSEAEQAAADDYAYEMYKENEWDDKK